MKSTAIIQHERRRDPLPGLAEKVTSGKEAEEICKSLTHTLSGVGLCVWVHLAHL